FQAEDGIRVATVTGVQTCALPISARGGTGFSSILGSRALASVYLRSLALASANSRSTAATSAARRPTSGYLSLNWVRSFVSSSFNLARRASVVSDGVGGPPDITDEAPTDGVARRASASAG